MNITPNLQSLSNLT